MTISSKDDRTDVRDYIDPSTAPIGKTYSVIVATTGERLYGMRTGPSLWLVLDLDHPVHVSESIKEVREV